MVFGILPEQGYLIRLVAAVVVILIGFIAARVLSRLTRKALHELETDKILREQAGVKVPLEEFLASLVKYLTYFAAIILALNQLGLTTVVLQIILFVALAIFVGFIILAFKDFIPNITSGFFLHLKKVINQGDIIKFKDIEGKVIHVNLIETKIQTKNKDIVYIPNSLLTKKEIIIKKKT